MAARHFADPAGGIEESPAHVRFEAGDVLDARTPTARLGFPELVRIAYERRVDLGARGFYATPGVDFNRETGRGNPFLYYTNGCAMADVVIDRLTGEMKVAAAHILIDIGRPINPAIDRGQVVGGFVQGLGWVTTEELRHDERGELLTCSPSTYKIPSVNDLPGEIRVVFHDDPGGPLNLSGSKAVGEPPFVLGLSVWAAVKDALRASAPGRGSGLKIPATAEEILRHLSGEKTRLATEITEDTESQEEGSIKIF